MNTTGPIPAGATPVRTRVAHVVTEATAPAILAVAGLLVVAIHSAGNGAGAAWGGFAALLVTGVPLAYVAKGVKAGKWSDHHIADRTQRAVPLLIASASVAVAAVLLVLVRAPRDLIALVLAQLAGLVVVLVVSRCWKISIHTAVAGGFLGILVVLFGPGALLGLPVLAAVGWSRIVLDAHTWLQVIAGGAMGALVAATLFPLFR
jgi:membrane-associated phospholipid phosphatase